MTKIRILQLVDTLYVGGAEVLSVNIHNELNESSHIEAFLVSTRDKGDLIDSVSRKERYRFIKKTNVLDPLFYIRLISYIRKNKVTVIHAHTTSYFSACILKILMLGRVFLVWHNHTGANVELKGIKFLLKKVLSKHFNCIIHVNKDLYDWGNNHLNSRKQLILLNFPMFRDLSKKTTLKGAAKKRIGIMGGLREVKDHLTLFKSFKQVINRFPDWSLHVIGKDYEDEYSRKLTSFVGKDLKLKDSVYFYGLRTDIENILKQLDIAVISSTSEGLPLALLEYGLAKLPVVATDVGQCKEVLKNDGMVVPKENSVQLSIALIKYIENSKLRSEKANGFYQQIKENYSKESFFKSLEQIYAESNSSK